MFLQSVLRGVVLLKVFAKFFRRLFLTIGDFFTGTLSYATFYAKRCRLKMLCEACGTWSIDETFLSVDHILCLTFSYWE